MRIISNHRDYYDAIQALGQDQSVVYVRNPQIECGRCHLLTDSNRGECKHCSQAIVPADFPFPVFAGGWNPGGWQYAEQQRRGGKGFFADQYVVGFCGKIYPVLALRTAPDSDAQQVFCINEEEVEAFIKREYKPIQVENYTSSRYARSRNDPPTPAYRTEVREYFDECTRNQRSFEGLFQQHKSPVFVGQIRYTSQTSERYPRFKQDRKTVYNANLAELKFYRIIDPQTAFQEISMYLTGVLGVSMDRGKPTYQGKPMSTEVSDEDLAAAKGYDKWSFRKEPGKMKRKKK